VFPALPSRLVAMDDALRLYGTASAAVALLLRERDGLEILVMERATRETDPWSGHWSFPGGRRRGDEPLLDAVCRETQEEVGLSPRRGDLIGCLPARAPANRPALLVLPFVFRWADGASGPHGPEVVSTAWVPLAALPASRTTMTIHLHGREVSVPAFVRAPWGIWGFTYRLLEDLLAVLQ